MPKISLFQNTSQRGAFRSRLINTFGLGMTAVVFVVVLLTKFLAGAWIAILAMVIFYAILRAIRRHYDRVELELTVEDTDPVLPTRVHAIVLVSKVHKPTMRALAYAKASRPNLLEAVMVATDPQERDRIIDEWDRRGIDIPLKVLDSPYREIIRPIVEYARAIRTATVPIGIPDPGTPFTRTTPSTISRSSGAASSASAATRNALSRTLTAAAATALPLITAAREANVPTA